jgi:poly-gamma-glutamate synthesis protein (capsule biosynthesis protein)
LVICLLFLVLACKGRPVTDYVVLVEGGEGLSAEERARIEDLFHENSEIPGSSPGLGPALRLAGPDEKDSLTGGFLSMELVSSWAPYSADFKDLFGDLGYVPLSLTWFVPREDPLAGRSETSIEACLAGQEELIPLSELGPPDIALRVDGLTVGDEGYPLVKVRGLRLTLTEAGGAEGGAPPDARKAQDAGTRLAGKMESLAAALRQAWELPPPPGLTWIACGGDVMFDEGAGEVFFTEGPAGVFGATAEMLWEADLALINLEGCVSDRGEKIKKSFNFRFEPRTAAALKQMGIDAVLIANNHIYDYGLVAFRDTLVYLQTAGLGILGAGRSDNAAALPVIFAGKGLELRVYGLASYPRERNGWDGLSVAAEEHKAGILHAGKGGAEKLAAQFVKDCSLSIPTIDIVLFHGGEEWSRRPGNDTRQLYTTLIRNGADLIIGSHPHVVQGFEWIDGKAIFWSLGNFVFGGEENNDGGEEGLFVNLGYVGTVLTYLEPHALTLGYTRTGIAPRENLETFYRLSRALRDRQP